jgi:sugar phosphate isomerase/epimerase
MATKFSLAHLSMIELTPPELIMAAAEAGYDYVGLRQIAVTPGGPGWALWDDPAMMAMTKRALADTGVGVLDVELFKLLPETDVATFEPYFAAAAAIGASHALTQSDDPEFQRLVDNYGALCDLAFRYGVSCDFEFIPWLRLNSLAKASELVRAVQRPNAGIMIDTLHFDRSGSTLDQIDACPPGWFRYIQLCDAPKAKPADLHGLLYAAREERLFPGEGELDLVGVLSRLPSDIPIGIEIPTETLSFTEPPEERARRAREAALRVLDKVEARRRSEERD